MPYNEVIFIGFLTALGNLAEVYVEAIRSGKVPCLENAVVSLAEIQNGRAVEQAMELYMKEMFERTQLPMNPEDLSDVHQMAEKAAVGRFITMSFNDNEQTHQKDLIVSADRPNKTEIQKEERDHLR